VWDLVHGCDTKLVKGGFRKKPFKKELPGITGKLLIEPKARTVR
jgi:hypothetical protein